MSIPFTQYLMPGGRKTSVEIDRPPEVEQLADEVISRGWVFECEMLRTGAISFTVSDGEDDVCIELSPNGPQVLDAVDKLVRDAAMLAHEQAEQDEEQDNG